MINSNGEQFHVWQFTLGTAKSNQQQRNTLYINNCLATTCNASPCALPRLAQYLSALARLWAYSHGLLMLVWLNSNNSGLGLSLSMIDKMRSMTTVAIFGSVFLLASCATQPTVAPQTVAPAPTKQAKTRLPEGTLERLLNAEIALRRNALHQALPLFANEAHETQAVELAITAAQLADFLKDNELALSASSIWLSQQPNDEEAIHIKAQALIRGGDLVAAFEFIESHSTKADTELFVKLASGAITASKAQKAMLFAMFDQALKQQPQHVGLLLGMGLLEEERAEISALSFMEKAAEIAPHDPMIANIKAAVELEHQLYDRAIATLDRTLSYQPNHYGLLRHRASALLEVDIMQAKEAYESLYQLSNNDPKVLYPLSQISMKLEFFEDARQYLAPLSQNFEYQDYAFYSLGLIAEHRGEHFIAMKRYADVSAEPYLYPALRRYERLALALSSDVEFEQHLQSLEGQALGKQRTNLIVHRAEFLIRNHKPAQANQLIQNALNDTPDDSKLLYALFLSEQQLGNYHLAVKPLEKMLSEHPKNPTLLNALGYTLSRYLGDHDRAKVLIESAHALAPDDPAIIDSMGWIHMQFGDLNTALGYFSDAYERSENMDIAVHIGEALWLQNNHERAKQWLNRVWQHDSDNNELQETLHRLNISLP